MALNLTYIYVYIVYIVKYHEVPVGCSARAAGTISMCIYSIYTYQTYIYIYLVGGLEHGFYFPFHIWDVILPIDINIFFKMVIAPPTRYIYPLVN